MNQARSSSTAFALQLFIIVAVVLWPYRSNLQEEECALVPAGEAIGKRRVFFKGSQFLMTNRVPIVSLLCDESCKSLGAIIISMKSIPAN